jgi:hypothetical protein
MTDYSNSVIYIIKPNVDDCDENDVYYGSTNDFINRCSVHKSSYYDTNTHSKYCSYFKIYDKYGIGNCVTEIIEEYPCNTKEELFIREKYYINNNPCINKKRPIITFDEKKEHNKTYYDNNKNDISKQKHEYYINNQNDIIRKNKIYRDNNTDNILIYNKNYYKDNTDHIQYVNNQYYYKNTDYVIKRNKEYYNYNKEQINEQRKQKYIDNKDVFTQKNKDYYEINKEKIQKQQKKQIYCKLCECYMCSNVYLRHERTTKHIINFINY